MGPRELPVLGRRFLRPFRVHHINPHDFLRRDFIDCNGDVAMLVLPMLAASMQIPLGTPIGRRRRRLPVVVRRVDAPDQSGAPVGAHAGAAARWSHGCSVAA